MTLGQGRKRRVPLGPEELPTGPAFAGGLEPVPAFLTTLILLALLVAGAVAAILFIRRTWLRTDDGRDDWERALGDYKNLREQGVLSEEEYRNIRTLVEPRTRLGTPASAGRPRPAVESHGPLNERK